MKYHYLFLLSALLLFSCRQDDEILLPSISSECQGKNMLGNWFVVDNVEVIYKNIDSAEHHTYYKQMLLYENGLGNLSFRYSSGGDYFFQWLLQCNPGVFTMSVPYNNEDSLFGPSGFYSIHNFDIIVNEIEYKKLKRETDFILNFEEQTHILTRELFKNP